MLCAFAGTDTHRDIPDNLADAVPRGCGGSARASTCLWLRSDPDSVVVVYAGVDFVVPD